MYMMYMIHVICIIMYTIIYYNNNNNNKPSMIMIHICLVTGTQYV